MKKKIIIGLSIITIIIIIIILTTFKKESEVVPEYVLTYAENHPEDYPTTVDGYKIAELVDERAEGRINIFVRGVAVMGDEKGVLEKIRCGGIDVTRDCLSVCR